MLRFARRFGVFVVLVACAFAANAGAFPTHAAAQSRWVAYCDSMGGEATTRPDGIAHCWVDGVDIFAQG